MIPKKYDAHEYDYPDFQTDQVLSADNLNHSFAFNEQQERLSRTNLIGIGIVCGLKATKSANGKVITITKGTGVTSHGYLIVHGNENSSAAIDYTRYRSFNAYQDIKYLPFISGTAPKYAQWELLTELEAKTTDPLLDSGFLANKVCVLFYEMLETNAKNCDTTSCDDKGKLVEITVRKLLMNASDVDTLIAELNTKAQASGSGETFPGITNLTELRMPRFDVLATSLVTTSDLFKAYQKIFTKALVENFGNALNNAYGLFRNYMNDSSAPFSAFNSQFAFLYDGTITGNNLLHFQYFYDFFCDILQAYNEWRAAALNLVALCTPPEALFPRHLLLCNFSESEGVEKSKYRNYFMPSPILAQHEQSYKEFKSLFQRLSRMISNRSLPIPTVVGTKTLDTNIRITPSSLGNSTLGNRAIPYYYKTNEAANKLIDVWNFAETKRGKQNQILSHGHAYNNSDDFVINPLRYDLEPYNFLRVEGHIGKSYDGVLSSLQKIINDNRLPVNVVALELSTDASDTKITDVCAIANIQMQYDLLRNEISCCLKKNISYWGKLELKDSPQTPVVAGTAYTPGFFIIATLAEKTIVPNETNNSSISLAETLKQVENTFRKASPKVMAEIRKMVSDISTAATTVSSAEPPKALLLKNTVEYYSAESIAGKYLNYQKNGNFSMGTIPVPSVTFNAAVLSHYAMIIIDEMEELLLLLQATDALSFDLTKFALHTEALKKAYQTLDDLLSAYLKSQKTVYLIKTTLGDTYNAKVDAIAAAIPDILEKNSSKIILLLLNPLDTTTTNTLIADLQKATTNATKQQVIDLAYSKLDKDGMMFPGAKNITYIEDPVLREISNRLKNPSCMCGYESFASLRDLLQKEIDMLKQFNLFSVFTKKHPGIQHKAGVPMGGTFILAYHKKGTTSIPLYENIVKELNDGIVVADFYLPYLCSSDCQPINFTINPPLLSLSLDKPEYCNDDETAYPFHANPTGGKLTSPQQDSVKDNGDGTFSFLPAKVKIDSGTNTVVSFTYTFGDQMQTISVKVDVKPAVKVIPTADATNPLKINFSLDNPALVTSATWNFGDGATSVEISPTHVFAAAGNYTVSCVVKNGVCTFSPENVVVAVKLPDPVVISFDKTEICKDALAVNFTVTPKGGSYTGEGFTESPSLSGNFTFTPSAVSSNATPQKMITFNYSPLAGSPKTINITVYEKPEADANFNVLKGTNNVTAQFVFSNLRNAATLEMDFGDGSPKNTFNVAGQTTFTTPLHSFPGAGPFKISARLINGTCSLDFKPLELTFDVVVEVIKVCQPLSIPVNDYTVLQKDLRLSTEFQARYANYMAEVNAFFASLKKQLSVNPNVPLSFFEQNPLKPEWVKEIPIIGDTTRSLAIRLLSIFSDLTTTISCLKGEDVDAGKVQTIDILNVIISKILELEKLSATDAELIKPLAVDLDDERQRIDSNQEVDKKKLFIDELNKLKEVLQSIS